MIAFSLVFLTLVGIVEAEFFQTAAAQQKEGYNWKDIDCRTPEEGIPSLRITTPTGNQYVCFKLEK